MNNGEQFNSIFFTLDSSVRYFLPIELNPSLKLFTQTNVTLAANRVKLSGANFSDEITTNGWAAGFSLGSLLPST